MNNTKQFLPQEPTFKVIVRCKVKLGSETSEQFGRGNNPYEWHLRAFFSFGLSPVPADTLSWQGRLTRREIDSLRNPKGVLGRFREKTNETIIESVSELIGETWQLGEDGEYLVANNLTFRLRLIWKQKTYNNLYVELHFLTTKGWTRLKETYCGDSYYGTDEYVRQSYERARRHAEMLGAIGATVSPNPIADEVGAVPGD